MTVRFNCWVEAPSIQEAWGKLATLASECELGKKSFKKEFTATLLEDPEEDKRELAPLTVKEFAEFLSRFCDDDYHCTPSCPFAYEQWKGGEMCCHLGFGYGHCPMQFLSEHDIDEMAEIVRGEEE